MVKLCVFFLTEIQVEMETVSSKCLKVTWKKPCVNPDKYRVTYGQKANPLKMKVYDTEGPDVTSLRIENLEPGKVYKVTVVSVLGTVESPEEPSGGKMVSMRMYKFPENCL